MSDRLKWFLKLPIKILSLPLLIFMFGLVCISAIFSSFIGIFQWALSDSTEFIESGPYMVKVYTLYLIKLFKYSE